mgnify:CR=1 FL=1
MRRQTVHKTKYDTKRSEFNSLLFECLIAALIIIIHFTSAFMQYAGQPYVTECSFGCAAEPA